MLTNRSGQVLTELLVALSVVIVGVLALVQLATKSISNSGFSKRQSEATSYGSSAQDWVREQRDTLGWDTFAAKVSGVPYCINGLTWVTGACTDQITGTVYSREVTLTSLGTDKLEAAISIKWQEGGKTFSSKQTTIFGRYTQSAFGALPTPTPTPTPIPSPTPFIFTVASSQWSNIQGLCAAQGGRMVTITDLAKNNKVKALCGSNCWIGYNDLAHEGTWVWPYGSSSYTNWASGEPNNNLNNQDCGQMYSAGTWDDDICTLSKVGACEKP